MTPDTSTAAAEAAADLVALHGMGNIALLIHALAAERDELVKAAIMQKAAYEGVSSMLLSVQKDCIAARRSALVEAAKVAEFYPVAGKITDEGFVPGLNYKSAIAFAIRALAEKEG